MGGLSTTTKEEKAYNGDEIRIASEPDGQLYDEEDYWDQTSDFDSEPQQDATFPIGYTIEFSPEPLERDAGDPGKMARGGLGSQALPVSEKLREDWDGVPSDGAEYLLTVRQEANSRPRVVSKKNPYATKKLGRSRLSVLAYRAEPESPPTNTPHEHWREHFLVRFLNMRNSLQLQEPWHWDLPDQYVSPPPANDESNWKIFITGKKSNLVDFPPKAPIPLFLKALEQLTVLAVLGHYQTWIQDRVDSIANMLFKTPENKKDDPSFRLDITLLSDHDGAWLLGLLSVLDSTLTAEDIYKLRELGRTCKQVTQIAHAALEIGDPSSVSNTCQEAAIGWMVIAAISDVWGQKDLWE